MPFAVLFVILILAHILGAISPQVSSETVALVFGPDTFIGVPVGIDNLSGALHVAMDTLTLIDVPTYECHLAKAMWLIFEHPTFVN